MQESIDERLGREMGSKLVTSSFLGKYTESCISFLVGLESSILCKESKSSHSALFWSFSSDCSFFFQETNFAMKFPDPPTTGPAMSLMSPMQFKALRKTNVPQDSFDTPEISQLNKQQFRDAFITLLQVCSVRKLPSSMF